jgi:hypothetical protein
MDATGYPAADGSQVTNINISYTDVTNATGKVLQTVQVHDGAVATGTTPMERDNTTPQNTEGDEYMTLAITPKSATSRLKVDVGVNAASSTASVAMITALFRDSVADALSVGITKLGSGANALLPNTLTYDMASPGTSLTTFKVRTGVNNPGTTTFNGESGAIRYGGKLASFITITEYIP